MYSIFIVNCIFKYNKREKGGKGGGGNNFYDGTNRWNLFIKKGERERK
jgi:hypothetical protein